MINAVCARCGHITSVADAYAGQTLYCSQCNSSMKIPMPGESAQLVTDGAAAAAPAMRVTTKSYEERSGAREENAVPRAAPDEKTAYNMHDGGNLNPAASLHRRVRVFVFFQMLFWIALLGGISWAVWKFYFASSAGAPPAEASPRS